MSYVKEELERLERELDTITFKLHMIKSVDALHALAKRIQNDEREEIKLEDVLKNIDALRRNLMALKASCEKKHEQRYSSHPDPSGV